jgi:hypothetical protein
VDYPGRVEVQLLLLQEHLEPGPILGFDHDSLIDRLTEADVPDEAICHTYGGDMATEAA